MASAARRINKHHRLVSLIFYRAVRDLKPVWMLEDMRTMETFHQVEDSSSPRMYSPSEALLYAIVHDHQAYAQFLLSRYAEEALAEPGSPFCCCPASNHHLTMAVRYDRRHILRLILQKSHRIPCNQQDRRCFHTEDGRSPLHLACELLRPEAVIMLLGNGASPHAEDNGGLTPLDVILEQIRDSSGMNAKKRQCLDNLLMFISRVQFKMKESLDGEPDRWRQLLGEDTYNYLSGRSPAPLVLRAMQIILKHLRPQSFADSLHQLPIPSSLKPPGLLLSQQP